MKAVLNIQCLENRSCVYWLISLPSPSKVALSSTTKYRVKKAALGSRYLQISVDICRLQISVHLCSAETEMSPWLEGSRRLVAGGCGPLGRAGTMKCGQVDTLSRVTGLLQFLTPISESPPPPLVIRRVDTVLQYGHSSIASISPRPFSFATSCQDRYRAAAPCFLFHSISSRGSIGELRASWQLEKQ